MLQKETLQLVKESCNNLQNLSNRTLFNEVLDRIKALSGSAFIFKQKPTYLKINTLVWKQRICVNSVRTAMQVLSADI